MESFVFGGARHERLEVNVLRYERAASGNNYHDDNWLSVEVSVNCGAFHGKFPAAFLTGELESFYVQLARLYETLTGKARFQTLEGQLELEVIGDGLGHISISGEAQDKAGIGNKLLFKLAVDQTQLQTSVQSLAAVTSAFPVRT